MSIASATATDLGRRRDVNEDAVGVGARSDPAETAAVVAAVGEETQPLWVVCDGMGGHAAGEIASRTALDAVLAAFAAASEPDPALALERAIRSANTEVWNRAQADRALGGMGTTVVAATVVEDYLVIAHAGDSRAYLLRDGDFRQLTDDHSWLSEQERLGRISPEERDFHPLRHTITRALGAEREVLPDLTREQLLPGDRILLCSDGLTNEITDNQLAALISSADDPDTSVATLIAAANEAGGNDNISVIILHVGEPDEVDGIDGAASKTLPFPPVSADDAATNRAPRNTDTDAETGARQDIDADNDTGVDVDDDGGSGQAADTESRAESSPEGASDTSATPRLTRTAGRAWSADPLRAIAGGSTDDPEPAAASTTVDGTVVDPATDGSATHADADAEPERPPGVRLVEMIVLLLLAGLILFFLNIATSRPVVAPP